MASEAFNVSITSSSEKEILETSTWTLLFAQLESAAAGQNFLGYGSSKTLVEAGSYVQHLVAPGTLIKLETTSATSVAWTFVVTEADFIDQILESICGIGQGS